MAVPNDCYCGTTKTELLIRILQRDRATFDRYSQIIQAFEESNGEDPSNFGEPASSDNCFCSDSSWDLLVAILEQRQSNFNRLQQVIEAI